MCFTGAQTVTQPNKHFMHSSLAKCPQQKYGAVDASGCPIKSLVIDSQRRVAMAGLVAGHNPRQQHSRPLL